MQKDLCTFAIASGTDWKKNDAGFQMSGEKIACMASDSPGDLTHICFNVTGMFLIILDATHWKQELVPFFRENINLASPQNLINLRD